MGPFELMDLIGNDVNYTVTETVWTQFYFDLRYQPSITQKRLKEAGLFGKKTGKGFYDYDENGKRIEGTATKDEALGRSILKRILVMLINEAVDASYLKIATNNDIEMAMTKGVNYPKGLLQWADELGLEDVLEELEDLYGTYLDQRYRPSILFDKMINKGERFYSN